MSIFRQIAILVVLAALAAGGWYGYKTWWNTDTGPGSPTGAAQSNGPRAVAVEVAPVRVMTLARRIESVGTAKAEQAITVAAQVSGTVIDLNFTAGQRVEAGDLLVEIDSAALAARLDELQALRGEAARKLERARALRARKAVAQAQVDALDAELRALDARIAAAEADRADYFIRAPFAGRVGLKRIDPGAVIQPGTAITTLDDTDPILVAFTVPETAMAGLQPGLEVSATSAAYPDRTFTGRVRTIDTRVDAAARAITVEAEIANTDDALKPGMFLAVDLTLAIESDAIMIPEAALVREGRSSSVYAVTDGHARRLSVETAARRPGLVEIASGLDGSETVVIAGHQKLRDGARVTVVDGPAGTLDDGVAVKNGG